MKLITLEDIKNNKPKKIYYSVKTVWWTDDPKDLKKGPVPLDVFGSVLFETTDVDGFLDENAINKQDSYGKNPLRNFMLSHAKNIKLACDKMPPRSFDLVEHDEFYSWCDENIKETQ